MSVCHELTPVREIEPGWWALKWRPIRRKTYNVWFENHWRPWSKSHFGIGFDTYRSDIRNGWGRGNKLWHARISFAWWVLNFWIGWDYVCHQGGPMDEAERRPLNIAKEPR